jgi:hypothetical protein
MVPEGMIPGVTTKKLRIEEWETWLDAELKRLVDLANQRNGNDYYSKRMAELEEWHHFADKMS